MDGALDKAGYEALRDAERMKLDAAELELARLRTVASLPALPPLDVALRELGGWTACVASSDVAGQRVEGHGHDVPGAQLTTPVWSADGASILYTYTPYGVGLSGADAEPRIERIRLDGTGREVLIREATTPAPSADGRALAYLKSTRLGDALWLGDANGQNGRELVPTTRFLGLAYPRISPDGAQIAFAATVDLATPSSPPGPSGPSTPSLPRTPLR